LKRIIKAGGRKGQIYAALRDLRDEYATLIRTKYPQIPRRVSGYNLDYLLPENGFHVARALVGTESTCAVTLRAKTRLIQSPQHRVLLLLAYPTVFAAADQSPHLQALGPIAIEGFQKRVIDQARLAGKHMPGLKLFPEGDAWLLVEFGADSPKEAAAMGKKAMRWAEKHDRDQVGMLLLEDPKQQKAAMEVRELGLGVSRVPGKMPNTWGGWDDAAVDPAKLGAYLREFYALLDRYNYFVVLYGHFGQGCLHTHMDYDLRTPEGVAHYRHFVTEAARLVVKYGGSISGEHGDGHARAELLPIMFGPELIEAFRKFKRIWDPTGRMNPGKIVDPYPLDTSLRTGPDYKPLALPTIFQFPDDHGSMAEATERCFGVGKCRKLEGGTMCPSFHATREEKHTTRGRARLLFEMLRGDSIPDTWRNEEVKEALDLCLACKGCKGDCPVSVDIATYKAEFLAHYYRGRLRPNYAYSMGLIDKWAALGSRVPALVNFTTQTPILRALAKKLAGVTQKRDMPSFPDQSFKQWLASREPATTLSSRPEQNEVERPAFAGRGPQAEASTPIPRGEVILWADTFNNFLTPHTAKAALAVLEDAGFRVHVPREHLCCGRPLYDFGMLDLAKQYLRKILTTLASEIAKGTPIIVLEPSCASVFKDELTNLFPNDEQAQRLSKQVI
ncbi:MAG TPA: FAD-linked oxidase C-terminal domain-containing protein, partial [Acidobacteriaceae bacterium]|nr:FAD-linked oxidase C-terminal domain-containing protein [Acidobacteriaceae bacterium]